MIKFYCVLSSILFVSGCATTTVHPLAPTSLKSSYRKTVEVILVSCEKDHRSFKAEVISTVESTDTGERFRLHGCYGKSGDRFKISY